jgi:hypothetical protein
MPFDISTHALLHVDATTLAVRRRCELTCPCRMLAVAVVIAIKFIEDSVYTNAHYAKVTGISLVELNQMEIQMCSLLDFSLHLPAAGPQEVLEQVHRLAWLTHTCQCNPHGSQAIVSLSHWCSRDAHSCDESRPLPVMNDPHLNLPSRQRRSCVRVKHDALCRCRQH